MMKQFHGLRHSDVTTASWLASPSVSQGEQKICEDANSTRSDFCGYAGAVEQKRSRGTLKTFKRAVRLARRVALHCFSVEIKL